MNHVRTDRLAQAHPLHQARMDELLRRSPVRLMIVRVYATPQEQFDLYKKGRQRDPITGIWVPVTAVVTRAKPGTSPHEVVTVGGLPASVATDVVPIADDGTPLWETPDAIWQALYQVAGRFCGLDALGDPWGRFLGWDKGHFEEPGWPIILPALGAQLPDVSALHV